MIKVAHSKLYDENGVLVSSADILPTTLNSGDSITFTQKLTIDSNANAIGGNASAGHATGDRMQNEEWIIRDLRKANPNTEPGYFNHLLDQAIEQMRASRENEKNLHKTLFDAMKESKSNLERAFEAEDKVEKALEALLAGDIWAATKILSEDEEMADEMAPLPSVSVSIQYED